MESVSAFVWNRCPPCRGITVRLAVEYATGFDAPKTTHVVVARPTVSQVLFEQMIGRGLRGPEFGGTDECVIIYCVDDFPYGQPKLAYDAYLQHWDTGKAA